MSTITVLYALIKPLTIPLLPFLILALFLDSKFKVFKEKKNKTDFKRFHFRVSGTIGTVPYIELNGEQFEDSNLIIEKLKLHFGVDPENGLRFVK